MIFPWETVQPLLHEIRAASYFTSRHAQNIIRAVEMLPAAPGFPTKAMALMSDAEKQLCIALEHIRQAKDQYENKPVISEPVHLQAAE